VVVVLRRKEEVKRKRKKKTEFELEVGDSPIWSSHLNERKDAQNL
jgi:hypothetical protein